MITRPGMRTIQVGLGILREMKIEWPYSMAASAFISIPVILLFLFVQKRFIEGVMMSGVKG
jgi:multiple sugar transport system permease protein